jgi:hypothetical protein
MPTFPLDLSLSLSASERPTVDTVFADRLYPAKFGLHTLEGGSEHVSREIHVPNGVI